MVWSWPGSAIPAILCNFLDTPVFFFISSKTDQMSLLWLSFSSSSPHSLKPSLKRASVCFHGCSFLLTGAVLNRGLVLFLLALTEPSKESVVVIWIYYGENTQVWKMNEYRMVGTENLCKELRITVPRWLLTEENLTCVSRGVRKESHIRTTW